MRSFLRYLLILAVIVVVAWIKVPQRYVVKFPRNPGPTFDRQVRNLFTTRINIEQPEIALLGDSTLKDGIDVDLLSQLTGRNISKFDTPGSASAYWYLVLKNNIIKAEHPPRVLVIIFRDTILTAPGYRVHGGYFVQLDEFAGRNEPLLLERSYLNLMNPVEKWSEQYFPLYGARGEIRKETDGWIRYSLPGWLDCNKRCTDDSMYDVFTSADLEPGQLQNAVATAEQYLYASNQLDFERQVDKSYLPEIIRLAHEHGIQLILVRLKNETAGSGNIETPAIRQYMRDLTGYLTEQNVSLLDYGMDTRLGSEYYKDSLHLNRDGMEAFTKILAEGLNKALR